MCLRAPVRWEMNAFLAWPRLWRAFVRSFLVGMPRPEREYRERCERRAQLSDEDFVRMYYPQGVNADVARRIRCVFYEQLKLDRVEPSDHPFDFLDVGIAEVVWEIADEFGVSVSDGEIASLDGSVDSIVRLFNRRVSETSDEKRSGAG